VHRQPSYDHRGQIDRDDVGNGDCDRAEEAREQERRATDGPDDQRLQQSAFRISAHGPQREKDGEDDAEEHRREERHARKERRCERARVDGHVARNDERVELAMDVVVRNPEQRKEDNGQEQDDREHAPPQRFAQDVTDDHRHGLHDVSPPTASR
jgi:hypothetical protein